MKTWLPLHTMILFLVLLALAAMASWSGIDAAGWLQHLERWAAIYLAGYGVSLVLQKILSQSAPQPEHRIITSLILFLLFDPTLAWGWFLAIGALTEIMERLLRTLSGPIFNPAGLTAFLMGLAVADAGWWGMSFPPRLPWIEGGVSVAMLLTVPLAGYVAYRYRKLPVVGAFLLSFLSFHFFLFQNVPIFLLFEGIMAFFLLVMVVEPKTSPALKKDQYWYGAVVGAGIPLFMMWGSFDAMLLALLIGNLYTARKFLFTNLLRRETA